MEKTIHIEINYTIPDTSKVCPPIIKTKIVGEDEICLRNILSSALYYLDRKDLYENELKEFKEEYKKEVKEEVIKEYLQNLLDGEKNIDKEQ